jgi:hypothetical protein
MNPLLRAPSRPSQPPHGAGLLAALAALVLLGCTPHFDWRDYQAPEGFVATFPARVQKAARPIDLDGLAVNMTMHAARVDETAFVVEVVHLPGASDSTLAKAEDAIVRGLVQNLGASGFKDAPVQIASVLPQAPPVAGRAIDASGAVSGQPMRLVGRVAMKGEWVYQIMVVGPASTLEQPAVEEAVDTFLRSVRLP